MIAPRTVALIAACVVAGGVSAQDAFSPARYKSGAVPPVPVRAAGGGQVFVEASVDRDGRVTAVTPLRATPPFTEAVVGAVQSWTFTPASGAADTASRRGGRQGPRTPVATRVLVAAVFRPPALNTPTLGELPKDVASASDEAPFPLATTVPAFPPRAFSSGVVLLEVRIDRNGAVSGTSVVRSAPPFDEAAQQSVAQWSFRPPRVGGQRQPAVAYALLGFPVPVGPPAAAPPPSPPASAR